jgi:multimeric flavodoxin WrbA
MAKTIVVLNGSAREGGNTDVLLEHLIDGAKAAGCGVVEFRLRNRMIANCVGCCTCKTESRCQFDDSMTAIRNALEKADIIVFGSPVYWCEITGLMKTCFDRLYFYHHPENKNLITGKSALVVTTMGEADNAEYETALISEFYRRGLNSLGIAILDMLVFSDLMDKEAISRKPEYHEQAYACGQGL